MLLSLIHLKGRQLKTSEGAGGRIRDFYFDEKRWTVKSFVVDSGAKFPAENIYIFPAEFNGPSRLTSNSVFINSTKKVRYDFYAADSSPSSGMLKSVQNFKHYYDQPAWVKARTEKPPIREVLFQQEDGAGSSDGSDNVYLRSLDQMTGYQIMGSDGKIGQVVDLIVDDQSWKVFFVVLETCEHLMSYEMLMETARIMKIEWPLHEIFTDMTREEARGFSHLNKDSRKF